MQLPPLPGLEMSATLPLLSNLISHLANGNEARSERPQNQKYQDTDNDKAKTLEVDDVISSEESADDTGSEDESIKYDTIKKGDFRKSRKILEAEKVKEAEVTTDAVETSENKTSPSEEIVCVLLDNLVSASVQNEGDENRDKDSRPTDK